MGNWLPENILVIIIVAYTCGKKAKLQGILRAVYSNIGSD